MVDEGGVSQTTLDFIAEHTSDIILRAARDGKIIYISPSIRSYGYEPEDLLGRFPVDLIHPEDQPGFIANSEALMTGAIAPPEKRQHRLQRRDGTWVYYRLAPAHAELIKDVVQLVSKHNLDGKTLAGDNKRLQKRLALRDHGRCVLGYGEM